MKHRRPVWRALSISASLLSLFACSTVEEPAENYLTLTAVDYSDLDGWGNDNLTEALPALQKSCERIITLPETRSMGFDGGAGRVSDWYAPCRVILHLPPNDSEVIREALEQWFQPYRAAAGQQPKGLFTGYYQAEMMGSRRQSAYYNVPLYARPAGLPLDPAKSGKPYLTRAEIEKGGLKGKTEVLLWVNDPIDAHILQIQGSGRIRLDDGSVVHVGFDGSNGHPFLGLGRILIDSGKLEKGAVTMQAVKEWLKAHPDEAPALMAKNNRYVFFRLIKGDGPIGAQGVALTAKRSLAVDPAFIAYGTPIWLKTTDPDGGKLTRLMVAQDTGAAIKGPVRGDYYWGSGEEAFEMAGRMKSSGVYYLLLPRYRTLSVALLDD